MSRFRGQFEAILAALSFGTTPILVKKGLRGGLHPFYGVTIAIGTALLVNILFVFLSGQWRKSFPLNQRGLLLVALAAGCNTAAALTYFGAMSLWKGFAGRSDLLHLPFVYDFGGLFLFEGK